MLLGCIGDDFTGSSDLANTLVKSGMATTQYCGVPQARADAGVEAGVVALKTRSIAPGEAIAQSLAALDWLREQGCRQFFFKYCSTFDSTPQGNIGPVAEALVKALSAEKVIVCPAFPATGRTRIFAAGFSVRPRCLSAMSGLAMCGAARRPSGKRSSASRRRATYWSSSMRCRMRICSPLARRQRTFR